ncbi:MutS-related protein [Occallatibacter riparius]|uniref:Mismatch repair protein n=1 Tax=Occallatibacter riparius TaxID=1002689 RepID=A0A9J7BM84_9BACT|nr:mismatch repair protein [Occallatibacter riparius]UWZ83743.1 mismatch repair protein [Occallatibacter riparius]
MQSLGRLQTAAARRSRVYGISKLVIAVLTLAAAGFLIHVLSGLLMLTVPTAIFLVLVVLHEKTLERMRYRARAIRFYEDGLARLNDNWRGRGETGDRFLDPAHPYARDLDIFGTTSVFQYLSTARTRAGEQTLANWLLTAAPMDDVMARQAAVRDLAPRLQLREGIASAGESVRSGVHPDVLSLWGRATPILTTTATRVASSGLALLWLLSIVAWIWWSSPLPALVMSLFNFGYSHRIAARLDKAVGGIERAAGDLELLAAVLALLESEQFTAPRLVDLQIALRCDGICPSEAIRKLARLADLIESRHSLFARPLDLVTFWSAQLVFLAERWQHIFGPQLRVWLDTVGELEALSSLSGFAFEHPDYAFPQLVEIGPQFDAECLAHPLLPIGKAVENDFCLDAQRQLMVLSGPNMAGKSTFIRAIGVNAVLAQCGAPVRARKLTISPLQVAASICILDSLSGGVSRFYAEIGRVKMITDLAQDTTPVLFLLDELLSGTNSHDRLIGTEFVLRALVEHHGIGIVSTHDLALTRIPETMNGRGFNAHFEDRIDGEALVFDYKLKPGVVQTSNALKLMRAIGLGVSE